MESSPLTALDAPPRSLAGDGFTRRTGALRSIILHELRTTLTGSRFRATSLLLIALMVASAFVSVERYLAGLEEHRAAMAAYEATLRGKTVSEAVALLHPALKPPWHLAFLADGGQSTAPDLYRQPLSAWERPELERTFTGNHRLGELAVPDWSLVLAVALPMAAFMLFYDSICGERQAGTLKLVLAQSVPRWRILAGKLAAGATCLALPFLIGAAASMAVITTYGPMTLDADELAKIALVVALGLWAGAASTLFALLVSSLVREPATSLVILSLSWVSAVIVAPAAGSLLARELHPVPTRPQLEARLAEIREDVAAEYGGRAQSWRDRESARADGFAWERVSAEAENRRFNLQEEVRRSFLESQLAQADLATRLAALSPSSLVQETVATLVGSGAWRNRAFLEQAWAFREAVVAHFAALDRRDPASPHILFFRDWVSQRPIDAREVPRFQFRERPCAEGLEDALPLLLLLALETLLVAALAQLAFARYHVD